jgi:asparagine synthase (glutamine-hydrolysing)
VEIRAKADNRHFTTDSDSEIALHLYDRLGDEFVHQLRGEYAVVIADQRRRRLLAVRDPELPARRGPAVLRAVPGAG